MKMSIRLGMFLIISFFILVFYAFIESTTVSLLLVNKLDTFNVWSGHDLLFKNFGDFKLPNKEWSRNKSKFTWVKYGYQDSDWALLCTSWLCVEDNGASKNRSKSLIVYSSEDFPFSEVSKKRLY